MKLLSFAVPCYNSEAYMEKCVNSLLKGGEDVEILIVDDGSKDRTLEIAEDFERRYPTIVRAIHQENKGHGGAVNTGIENATGLYFKVVDSDDWVKEEAYMQVIEALRELVKDGSALDMLVCNYVYEKEGETKKRVISYRHAMPVGQMFTWNDVGHFKKGQYILMHSVIFRTKLLKECGIKLPEHTFYVDNLYVFEPLPHVVNMYYLDVNFYRYYIGREDQSVNEQVMIRRIDQQMLVNRKMYEFYSGIRNAFGLNKKLKKYMFSYLEIITTVSSVLCIVDGSRENLTKKEDLWAWMKQTDKGLYGKLRGGFLGECMNLPGRIGRKISCDGYHLAQKFFHFN